MSRPESSDPQLAETFVEGEEVYSGALLHVRRDVVRLPSGRRAVREYIRHPGAAVVVALFDDERVLLERQYRYPHARVMVELPAGKLDPGEPHLATAQRELLEETGYVAAEWTRLGVIHTSIGYADETIELFLAKKLTKKEASLDAGEFLEVLKIPFREAIDMIRDGRISDSKSVIGLLWVDKWAPR